MIRQLKLFDEVRSPHAKKSDFGLPQKVCNDRIANFIVSNNLFYRLVEDKSFRMVLSAFNPQRRPIGRHKLLTLLNHK